MKRVKVVAIGSNKTNNIENRINEEIIKLEEHNCKIINVVFGGDLNCGLYALIFYEVRKK